MMSRILHTMDKNRKKCHGSRCSKATDYQKNRIESKMFLTRGMSDRWYAGKGPLIRHILLKLNLRSQYWIISSFWVSVH